MVIILMVAAVVSCAVTLLTGENNWIEPIAIIVIVIANALLGVIQESKAEKALQALRGMVAPSAKVVRDGKVQLIRASELVPGDVFLLEAGDFIPGGRTPVRIRLPALRGSVADRRIGSG